MTLELLPTRVRYTHTEPVTIEVRAGAESPSRRPPCAADDTGRGLDATLTVRHLGHPAAELHRVVHPGDLLDLGVLPPGGYGIELTDDCHQLLARTAVEVIDPAKPAPALRYGFVTDYAPDRDPAAVVDNTRRLHLTHIQFYDWAYRHADLLGGGENYRDALDQPISLATVRGLITALGKAGVRSLGYTAVYGVGDDEWPQWSHAALLRPTGQPYSLGEFLRLVDPAEPKWLAHLTSALVDATDRVGFDGFHLDQYGYPKIATSRDRDSVDLADSFATTITAARQALPEATLVFNNVNDFPTWRTAGCPQDAIYIEVWPPHVTLGHLADLVTRTHAVADDKPVVIAAYQHVYDTVDPDDPSEADRAAALTMATLFSYGATHLLCGEADRILVDPYYVRNHQAAPATRAMLTRWYDFAVEHSELLFTAAARIELTGALAGGYNDDCDVTFAGIEVRETATAGTVWRRITHGPQPGQLVVHLINLVDQTDTLWDAPRRRIITRPTGTLRVRRVGTGDPGVRVADPDTTPALRAIPAVADPTNDWITVVLPALTIWQVLLIDLTAPDPDQHSPTTSAPQESP